MEIMLSVAAFIAALVGLAAYHRLVIRPLQSKMAELQRRLDDYPLQDSIMSLGERLVELEIDLASSKQKQTQFNASVPSEQNFSYALELAKNGATLDKIMSKCNITQSEAELMMELYGGRHAQYGDSS